MPCGFNEKSNSCDFNVGGYAKVRTDDPHYSGYIPSKWMKNDGKYDYVKGVTTYDAVPVYEGLQWGMCVKGIANAQLHATYMPAAKNYWPYVTGIGSHHQQGYGAHGKDGRLKLVSDVKQGGYNYEGGGKCPNVFNTGKTPAPQRKCHTSKWDTAWQGCTGSTCQSGYGDWRCRDTQKKQWLLAQKISNSTCESIGKTSAGHALNNGASRDAIGKGSGGINTYGAKTKDPRFVQDDANYGYAMCSYPIDSLQNANDVAVLYDNIRNKKIPGNLRFVGPLMENYCGKVIDNTEGNKCIGNHHTGVPSKCSNYFAKDVGGDLCRDWLKEQYLAQTNNEQTHRSYDNIVGNHCDSTGDLDECMCVNRMDDPVYQDIRKYSGNQIGNASCWYKPCAEGIDQGMLRDTDIESYDTACADTCSNVISIVGSHYNTLPSDYQQQISCGGVSGIGDTGSSVDLAETDEQKSEDAANWFTQSDNLPILIGGGLTVIIIIGLLAYLIFGDDESNQEKQLQKVATKPTSKAMGKAVKTKSKKEKDTPAKP